MKRSRYTKEQIIYASRQPSTQFARRPDPERVREARSGQPAHAMPGSTLDCRETGESSTPPSALGGGVHIIG